MFKLLNLNPFEHCDVFLENQKYFCYLARSALYPQHHLSDQLYHLKNLSTKLEIEYNSKNFR